MESTQSQEKPEFRPFLPHELPVYDGISLPGFPPIIADTDRQMTAIREFESRDSDILVCAYPKSGSHWMSEIVEQLIAGKAEYSTKAKEGLLLEFVDLGKAGLDDMPAPRNLNTHLPFRMLPEKHIHLKAKIIHMIRNPKDVAVSAFHHFQKDPSVGGVPISFADFLHMFIGKIAYGTWFEYEKDWEQVKRDNSELNILTVYYEKLKLNPEMEIKRIAEFLGYDYKDDFIKQVAEKVDFKNQSKGKFDGSQLFSVDKKPFIYRKGQIGDWKNWFTVAQNEMFDDLYEKEMKDSKLQIIFSQ